MKRTRRIDTAPGFERLENRSMLAVTAGLVNGNELLVSGIADGTVLIVPVAQSPGVYSVTDNGQLVGQISGVGNIRVLLDQIPGSTHDDNVQIVLGQQPLDTVFADLGRGDNDFSISGSVAAGTIRYHGGDGKDNVSISVDTLQSTIIETGGGDDTIIVNADADWLMIRAEEGNDRIFVRQKGFSIPEGTATLANSPKFGAVSIDLGNGNNELLFDGQVEHHMGVFAGNGNDFITIDEIVHIDGRMTIKTGTGNNQLLMKGTVDGTFRVRGGGSNSITLTHQAEFHGLTSIIVDSQRNTSPGRNSIVIDAAVQGNLFIDTSRFDSTRLVDLTDPRIVTFAGTESASEDLVILGSDIAGTVRVKLGYGENRLYAVGDIGGDLWVVARPDSLSGDNNQLEVFGTVAGTKRVVTISQFPIFHTLTV